LVNETVLIAILKEVSAFQRCETEVPAQYIAASMHVKSIYKRFNQWRKNHQHNQELDPPLAQSISSWTGTEQNAHRSIEQNEA
jgi:hypothetical protein